MPHNSETAGQPKESNAPQLKLWLLGPWQALLNGVPLAPLPTRHARSLLARLALAHPAPLSRATLRADVFAGVPLENTAHSLRTTLYYLRRALGECIWSEGEQVGLDPRLVIWTDVAEFEVGSLPNASQQSLEQAIACYNGPFLERSSEGWAASRSQQLHARYVEALRRLVALTQATGAHMHAAEAARRWAAEEPWDEAAHLALLHALCQSDQREAAETALQQARALLRSEWQTASHPALEAVAREIARMPRHSNPTLTREVEVAPPRGLTDLAEFDYLPLIGREQQIAQLTAAWAEARRGSASCQRVEGMAGLGKTRLAREMVARARLHADTLVLWGRAGEYTAGVAFGLLRDMIARAPEATRQLLHATIKGVDEFQQQFLCQIIPEFAQLLGQPVAEAPPIEAAQHARQHAALLALFDALIGPRALIMVLDNAHQADPDSLDLALALGSGQRRVLVLMLRRPQPNQGSDPLATFPLVNLAPLQNEATEQLVRAALGGETRGLHAEISARSGGNPLFAREILRALLASGLLIRDANVWRMRSADLPLPELVADMLLQRLHALSANARVLAELLAVLGQPAHPACVARLAPQEAARLEAQAELLEQHVLVERGGYLRFDHDWLRETLLASLDTARRTRLHRQVAAVLDESERAIRMWHHAGAEDWRAALDDALHTAQSAVESGHPNMLPPILALVERAIEALQLTVGDRSRWQLLLLRESYCAMAERGETWHAVRAMLLTLAESTNRPEWLAEALCRNGRALRELGQPREAEAHLRRAADLATQHGLRQTEANARMNLASVLDDRGAISEALHESRTAACAAEGQLRARAELTLAYVHMRAGNLAEADSIASALVGSEAVRQMPTLAGRALRQLGIIKMARQEYEAAFGLLRKSVAHVQAAGDLHGMLIAQTSLFYELVNFGLYDEARPLGEATLALARQLGARMQQGALLSSLALTFLHSGEPEQGLPLALESAEIAESHQLPEYAASSLKLVANIELALSRPHAARAALEQAEALLAPVAAPQVQITATAARVWLALGSTERARHAACSAAEQQVVSGLGAAWLLEDLWWAADVLGKLQETNRARTVRQRAHGAFLDRLATLEAPAMRRAFLASTEAHRALAREITPGPRCLVLLPHAGAPTGRPLHADELVPVIWRLHGETDPSEPIARRRTQLQRLADEARDQQAIATVDALAAALAVAPRTLKHDLQALRAAGIAVPTRGGARTSHTGPAPSPGS